MLGYAKQNAYDISHLSGVFDEILKLRTFGKQIEFKTVRPYLHFLKCKLTRNVNYR